MACGIWLLVFICFKLCVLLVGTPPSCPSGQYVVPTDDGDKCCQMCRPGNRTKPECTALQSTFCAVCGDGTYMDKYTARKQCHQCLNCTKGTGLRRIRSCKFDRNTMCEPLEGFLCVRGSVDRCVAAQQHSTCAPGQYISTAGTSSTDTVCGDCREGTFSDGTFMSCQNHTQCSWHLKQGTNYADSVCLEGLTAAEWTGLVIGILLLLMLSCVLVILIRKHRCQKVRRTAIPADDENKEELKEIITENKSHDTAEIKCVINNTSPKCSLKTIRTPESGGCERPGAGCQV
ncbi:tumor necrosis factor receptor superfamily member 14-like isoform X1 [Synchiropus splendidus]|uniref:tumor necrosis factor receptor superfamily member 14-like isoform X1 n=1 Tax=Synchiropus splendidus TaxID=270530 RepID=UPI00237D8935|nr:tumor necrosis factor receptor superfamily member 14-like isoform X1 [Synchiropus splendidus]